MVVTSAEAIEGDSVDLRAQLTIKGTTKPLPLKTRVTLLDDGAVQLTTQGILDRQEFGVDGNLMGMIGDKVTISGDVVFAAPGSRTIGAWPSHARYGSSSTATTPEPANRFRWRSASEYTPTCPS